MPRTCTICSHKGRRKIDKALSSRATNRAIAGQYGVARSSVQRHRAHVSRAVARASEKRELSIGEDILGRLETLYQLGLDLLSRAERSRNYSAAAGFLRELRGILSTFYEVAREVAPKSAAAMALPEEYMAAISRALGVTAFKPRIKGQLPPPSSNDQNGSRGTAAPAANLDDELPILP